MNSIAYYSDFRFIGLRGDHCKILSPAILGKLWVVPTKTRYKFVILKMNPTNTTIWFRMC